MKKHILQQMIEKLKLVIQLLKQQIQLQQKMSRRDYIHFVAKECLGKDMGPKYNALSCAESVNAVVKKATGRPIGGEASTYLMYQAIKKRNTLKYPLPGDLVICPTGYGNGKIKHGHVWIMSDNEVMLSNNSDTGLWDNKWTLEACKEHYNKVGGFPVLFYKI